MTSLYSARIPTVLLNTTWTKLSHTISENVGEKIKFSCIFLLLFKKREGEKNKKLVCQDFLNPRNTKLSGGGSLVWNPPTKPPPTHPMCTVYTLWPHVVGWKAQRRKTNWSSDRFGQQETHYTSFLRQKHKAQRKRRLSSKTLPVRTLLYHSVVVPFQCSSKSPVSITDTCYVSLSWIIHRLKEKTRQVWIENQVRKNLFFFFKFNPSVSRPF